LCKFLMNSIYYFLNSGIGTKPSASENYISIPDCLSLIAQN